MDKGVSPLIATVILIAFVVAVAAIASQFLTGFSQERASQVEREGEETVDCSLAAIEIDPDSVKWTNSSFEILLTVENTGREDLGLSSIVYANSSDSIRNTTVPVRKSDDSYINASSNPLEEGDIVTIYSASDGPFAAPVPQFPDEEVTVTTSCAGITSTVTYSDTDNRWERV